MSGADKDFCVFFYHRLVKFGILIFLNLYPDSVAPLSRPYLQQFVSTPEFYNDKKSFNLISSQDEQWQH